MDTKAGEIFKQQITRYLDTANKRVPPDTPGARKVVVESRKWYGRVQDPATGKWRLVPLSKDKQAARKKLNDLDTDLARGEAGLIDPFKQTKQTDLSELLQAYLDDLESQGRSERYRKQTEREVNAVVKGCEAVRLADLTADKVDAYLKRLSCSARSRNSYRRAAIGLCNYLVRKKKLATNPLLTVTRHKGEVKRKRRALPAAELQTLLDTARQRALLEAMTVRRGPRKGQLLARVTPHDRQRLERIGRHRALLYLTAVHTGLRLKALRHMKVAFLDLDSKLPKLSLPGSLMKSGRDFSTRLRDDLVVELKAWLAETGKKPDDTVFDVPAYSQVAKLLKKDLKQAGSRLGPGSSWCSAPGRRCAAQASGLSSVRGSAVSGSLTGFPAWPAGPAWGNLAGVVPDLLARPETRLAREPSPSQVPK